MDKYDKDKQVGDGTYGACATAPLDMRRCARVALAEARGSR